MAEENSTTNEGKNDSVKGIRTFEDDIANYTKEKNFSILDIAAEEAKVRGLSFENPEERKSFLNFRKIIFILVAVLLVSAGGYFGFAKPLLKRSSVADNFIQITQGPILTDQKIEIIASQDKKEVFKRDLKSALDEGEDGGTLSEISVVKISGERKTSLTKDEFLFMLGVQMPQGLKDYLEKDFMLLSFGGTDNSPILIFKSKSYTYVFSEMLKWEKSLTDDLKAIFPNDSLTGNDSFADKYIQNHDARIAEKDGQIDLAYAFINRKYLVITNNQEPLSEIFRRFSSVQYANPRAGW